MAGLVLSIPGCSSSPRPEGPLTGEDVDLVLLANWLSGGFGSGEQAARDSSYFDIRLHMVPIWREREDGYWLYVEQAVAEHEHRPYRQRVYHLTRRSAAEFESAVYTLPAEEMFVGAWRSPAFFGRITPASLTERSGCEIVLRKEDERAFTGRTGDRTCSSELRGASYATSEVTITSDGIVSWDRGFDERGEQVWGATAGGYVFRRLAE
ncbi:MAG: chromophore lyase CpcT/CpeT [Candidatus Eisenbacteria bacterium]